MMVRALVLTLALLLSGNALLLAQNPYWTDIDAMAVIPKTESADLYLPSSYRAIEANLEVLRTQLRKAPMEFTPAAYSKAVPIWLPLPEGGSALFAAVESPVLKPALAARYPQIKTYSAKGIDNPRLSARFGITHNGLHAIVETESGTVYIDPLWFGQTDYYRIYYPSNVDLSELELPALSCGWSPDSDDKSHNHTHPESETVFQGWGQNHQKSQGGQQVNLRVYDMALACTSNFAAIFGGSLSTVMSAFATCVNRLNQITMSEVAIKFELVENNDLLIFLTPAEDPYTTITVGSSLLGQNPIIINGIIPESSYDIGHVFTGGCSDVGGVVSGVVCTNGKARGVTCHSSANLIGTTDRILSHEIAHQYSVSHSWSNCPSSMGQLASGSAYEPGSGSTIMSYAGACGNQNIQFNPNIYYHARSIEQYFIFSRQGTGNTCATIIPLPNNDPILNLPYTNGFYIPISTPFELTAIGDDPDGDPLTYCWEQYDLGPTTELGSPTGNAPIFRSFPPTSSPTRVFPRLPNIIANFSNNQEVLPTYTRDLTFRCTARDNRPEGGGTVYEEVKFRATETAGPFLVTAPNAPGLSFEGGKDMLVTWDVANTDNQLVNCQEVDIYLSVDGGNTYPHLLLASTPNNGQATVSLPVLTSNTARIRVQAAKNIFFDISDSNFSITPASEPGFTFSASTAVQQLVCLPSEANVSFATQSVLNYNNPIQLEVIGGLPTGVVANFTNNPVEPGSSSTLLFNFDDYDVLADTLFIEVQAAAADQDTVVRTIVLRLFNNRFDALEILSPLPGASGAPIATTFSWTDVPNADLYQWELATSPAFGNAIINSDMNVVGGFKAPGVVLDPTTLYFWRLRPVNVCGTADYIGPFAFHTLTFSCDNYLSTDVPMPVPGGQVTTRTSELTVFNDGIINKVNVISLTGNYDFLSNIGVWLESPEGTEIKLFSGICGNILNFNLALDDESPFTIQCPPTTGQAYRPQEPLATFIGENTFGTWKLNVKVNTNFGNSGSLQKWGLQFCASASPNNPYIVHNEPLRVQPNGWRIVSQEKLLVEDIDNSPEELTYTVVTPPKHGRLYWVGNEVPAGGKFRQLSINANNVIYAHEGDDNEFDSFTFVVQDGNGGWVGIETFHIVMDPNAPVSTGEVLQAASLFDAVVYPNPGAGEFQVDIDRILSDDLNLTVYSLDGRQVHRSLLPAGAQSASIRIEHLPDGMYLLQLQHPKGLLTRKLQLIRP